MIDRKFKKDTVITYLSNAGVAGSAFVFMGLLTRFGGIASYGALTVLIALSSVLSNLMTFRTNEAVITFYKQGEATGELSRCRFALAAGIVLDVSVGIIIYALVYWQADVIAAKLIKNINTVREVRLYSIAIFFIFIKGTPLGYFQAIGRFTTVNAVALLEQLCKVGVLTGYLCLYHKIDLLGGVISILFSATASSIGINMYAWVLILARFKGVPYIWDRQLAKDYTSFSGKTFLSTALKAGNQNIETLVLAYLATAQTVGVYSLFKQFLSPLSFLSAPFASISYPKFVQAVVEKRFLDLKDAVSRLNRKLFYSYLLLVLGIAPAMCGYLYWNNISLQCSEYVAFLVMILTSIIMGQLWWCRGFSNALDPGISLRANFIATAFLLLTLFPFTYAFGLIGTVAAMFILALLLSRFWRKELIVHA